jgi:hypothetical protein
MNRGERRRRRDLAIAHYLRLSWMRPAIAGEHGRMAKHWVLDRCGNKHCPRCCWDKADQRKERRRERRKERLDVREQLSTVAA